MNILFATAYPPVLHRHGGGVRMFHNIRILAEKHRVHVLSFVGNDDEVEILSTLKPFCESVRGIRRVPDFSPHWLSTKPFMVYEFSTPEMHKAVDEMLRTQSISVLQCEYLQMAQFRRERVFTILTAHEARSKNAWEEFELASGPVDKLRFFYRWMQMLSYEVQQVRKFDRVITMTEEDADYLRSYARDANIRSIPIGIDPEEFRPVAATPSEGVSALFMGNFFHDPNVEAARFLAEKIAPSFPELTFRIAGSPIPQGIDAGPNVKFLGHTPDTKTLYHSSNTIFVAPLFTGTGQRVKLLEAFSMACPVVTTPVGVMGFPAETGVNVCLAESASEFISALRRLVAEPELRRRIGDNARAMILERFTWSRISKDLLDVVAEASKAD